MNLTASKYEHAKLKIPFNKLHQNESNTQMMTISKINSDFLVPAMFKITLGQQVQESLYTNYWLKNTLHCQISKA